MQHGAKQWYTNFENNMSQTVYVPSPDPSTSS